MSTCTAKYVPSIPPVHLDNVSLETMAQVQDLALETATNVFNCATQTQSKVCTIHGPASEQENKESFPHVYSSSLGNDFFVSPNEVLHINPGDKVISLIFSGLHDNTVLIHGKVNHVLIRKSDNVRLDIKQGTVSGVDVIYCKHMMVVMPYHNFTNIEFGESVYFQADIKDISQLHLTGSLDVKINGTAIPINPFISAVFGKDGWCYKKQSEIPKLMLCKY